MQVLVSLGIQQRLLRFLERSRMSGACSQQSSVSSVPSTARTNDSVVSEHCVRILNKLKTRGSETWKRFERGQKMSSQRGKATTKTRPNVKLHFSCLREVWFIGAYLDAKSRTETCANRKTAYFVEWKKTTRMWLHAAKKEDCFGNPKRNGDRRDYGQHG